MNNFSSKIISYINEIKRKPLFITIAVLSSVVIGVVAFTDSLEKIYSRIHSVFQLDSMDLSGYWVIGESKKTQETYIKFQTLGDKIVGTTTVFFKAFTVEVFGMPITVPIYNVKLEGNLITFTTKRNYVRIENDLSKDYAASKRTKLATTWHYKGEVRDNSIIFFINSDEGNYYAEVIAKKIDIDSAKSLIKRTYKMKYGREIEHDP